MTDKKPRKKHSHSKTNIVAEELKTAIKKADSSHRKKLRISPEQLEEYGKKIDPLQKTSIEANDENNPGSTAPWYGGQDRLKQEAEILMLDWAIRFPLLKPKDFLIAEKGYAPAQAFTILKETGGETEWQVKRAEIQDKLTESVVKRHVDQIAEVQETHVKASKIALAKAIEMLTKLSIEPYKDEDGKIVIDPKTKRPVYRGFRSIDLMNVTNAIEKAQTIYHRAMGLPTSGEGMAQVLEKVTQISRRQAEAVNPTTVNVTNITVNPAKAEAEKKIEAFMEKLDYSDIREFVEYRRQQRKKEQEKTVDAEFNDSPDTNQNPSH